MATRDRRRYSAATIATIATTSTSDAYVIAPVNDNWSEALFSAMMRSHSTAQTHQPFHRNLGQAGAG